MIREKKTYPFVKRYKSLFFWRECRFCNNEFKNENGFIIEEIFRLTSTYSYCCPYCALTIDDVKEKVKNDKKTNSLYSTYSYFPNSIDSYEDD